MRGHVAETRYSDYLNKSNFSGLENASVLDIGAGNGLFSLFIASRGVKRVVALEPDISGGRKGRFDVLKRNCDEYNRIEVHSQTFQDFREDNPKERFDLIVAFNVVNHIDEKACATMDSHPESFKKYVQCFSLIHSMLSIGGIFMFTDVSPRNFWARIVGFHPLISSIKWELHQTPQVWEQVLLSAGFSRVRISWPAIYPLISSPFLRWVAGRKLIAYFLTSEFLIVAKR